MIVGRRKQHSYYRPGGVSFGTRHLARSNTGCLNGSGLGTNIRRYVAGRISMIKGVRIQKHH